MTDVSHPEASRDFAATATSVRDARRFVTSTFHRWGAAGVEEAALLASELATNAVVHAGSAYTVSIELLADRVRIGVWDGSAAAAVRRDVAPSSDDGRGLGMVGLVASAWGVDRVRGGKCVWFELAQA